MPNFYKVGDEYWTDVDPHSSELWVIAGPVPFLDDDVTLDSTLPDRFRFVKDDEWSDAVSGGRLGEILTMQEAQQIADTNQQGD